MSAETGRLRLLTLGVALGALLAGPGGAAVPRNPVAPPHMRSADDGAIVARALERAQAHDCHGVLALLDPVVAKEEGKGTPTRFSAQLLRLPCLAEAGRQRDLAPALAELRAQAPDNPLVQGFQVFVDADAGHYAEAADGLAAIADARSRALAMMPGELWRALAQKLTAMGDVQRRDRVSLALALADWEPTDEPALPEALAADGIGTLLDHNAPDDARQLLGRVHRPNYLWEMAIQRRYAALWPDVEARMGPAGGTAIDRFARSALDIYASTPQDQQATLDAARAFLFLRRYEDVGVTAGPTRIAPGMTEQQVGIVLTDAEAMAADGHRDQALARLRPFATADLATTPEAASALITLAEMLHEDGRYDEELVVARTGTQHNAQYFSAYGLNWLRRNEVCALAGLQRSAEEKVAADALKAASADNQAAAVEGLLCAGRDEEAAAIAVATLATHEGADRIADQFQPDGALLPHPASRLRALWARLLQRADVKASFDRAARILPKTYWPATAPRALPAPTGAESAAATT